MLTLAADSPSWLSGVFVLSGAIVGAIATIGTQFFVARLNRVRDRYAKLREAYSDFGASAVDLGRAWTEYDNLQKGYKNHILPLRGEEFTRLYTTWKADRDVHVSMIDTRLSRLAAAYTRLLPLEHDQRRIERFKKYYEGIRTILVRAEYLRDVQKETDAGFLGVQAIHDLPDWLIAIGSSLREEEEQGSIAGE